MNIEKNISLAKYCTWHVGGAASFFIRIKTKDELKQALNFAEEKQIKYFILGGGSNILFSDDGFKGLIIKIEAKNIQIDGENVKAEAGAVARLVALRTAEKGLTGFEHLAGIPGTIGGLVRGNAGSFGVETKDHLTHVVVFVKENSQWKELSMRKENIHFSYRDSVFKREDGKYIIWEASFRLSKGSAENSLKLIEEDLEVRKVHQPYNFPSAGSVFKNPPGNLKAAALIEKAGCKGLASGAAQVSEKHANFIINKGGATSKDILNLIQNVKRRVQEDSNIILEEEIIII